MPRSSRHRENLARKEEVPGEQDDDPAPRADKMQDVCIVVCDGLKGLPDSVTTA
jgi:hypothetical protein